MAGETREIRRTGLGQLSLFLNLYDIFGYLIPGFALLLGLYLISLFFRPTVLLNTFTGFAEEWYGVIFIIVFSYVLGHVMSGLSKGIERIPDYKRKIKLLKIIPIKSFSEYLFEGSDWRILNYFLFAKECSPFLKKRFLTNYYKIVLGLGESSMETGPQEFIKKQIKKGKTSYRDLIWDASVFLLDFAPAQYNVSYSFLVLTGLFRALSMVWLLLIFFLLYVTDFVLCRNPGIVIVLVLLSVLFLASFVRYVKFGKMHNYQIIRSFALFRKKTYEKEPGL